MSFADFLYRPEMPPEVLAAVFAEVSGLKKEPPPVVVAGGYGIAAIFRDKVVKTPKKPEDAACFPQEYKLLQALEGKGLPVPEVDYVGRGAPFFVMPRVLGGTPLQGDLFNSNQMGIYDYYHRMDKAQQRVLADDIGGFIADLNGALTPAEARAVFSDRACDILTPISQRVSLNVNHALAAPHVRLALGDRFPAVEKAMQEYLGRRASRQDALFHNDLHPGNIFVDPAKDRFMQVIDLGRADYGGPDAEFALIADKYTPVFTAAVIEAYQKHGGQPFEYRDIALRGVSSALVHYDETGPKVEEPGFLFTVRNSWPLRHFNGEAAARAEEQKEMARFKATIDDKLRVLNQGLQAKL